MSRGEGRTLLRLIEPWADDLDCKPSRGQHSAACRKRMGNARRLVASLERGPTRPPGPVETHGDPTEARLRRLEEADAKLIPLTTRLAVPREVYEAWTEEERRSIAADVQRAAELALFARMHRG